MVEIKSKGYSAKKKGTEDKESESTIRKSVKVPVELNRLIEIGASIYGMNT